MRIKIALTFSSSSVWIALSSAVIIFNKWVLDRKGFKFPIFLTTWHLVFATVMTQLMARFSTLLDSRKKVPMTGRVYLRAIVPIGAFFSLSLIFSNAAYLFLSVAFIQMLKVRCQFVGDMQQSLTHNRPLLQLLCSSSPGVSVCNLRTSELSPTFPSSFLVL